MQFLLVLTRNRKATRRKPIAVAKMLSASPATPCVDGKAEIWIVDEASMRSVRDGEALFAPAQAKGAPAIKVRDVKQLGSVAAGRALGQLQDAGMETLKLAEIVRHFNHDSRRSVEKLLSGNAAFTDLAERVARSSATPP